ncbi:MAG: cobyrinate a,c-diamide synthase [Bacteroidales bacterium]|nr:cobyrinate a,c-diamide synthase [Bacteroidales bacterium]
MKPQFLIGAMHSGSGKSTFTMGILRLLRNRDLRVQPFKCGPDYIDTQFHRAACGRQSINLDTWLASESHLSELYGRYGADADACVVEGVMGLCDGFDRIKGSSAEIAGLLGIPVILVVAAPSMGYTLAALLYGLKSFCPQVNIAGVVFNKVSGATHEALLHSACEDAGLRCYGCLPRCAEMEIPSRHLGLTLASREAMDTWADRAAGLLREGVDIDRLLADVALEGPKAPGNGGRNATPCNLKIAVARDEAFNFIYADNIDSLSRAGEVSYFSPLAGDSLPQADMLYLPGGYPELYAPQLAANKALRKQIRDFAEAGGRIFAECGGMIYLGQSIEGIEGGLQEMCGVLPIKATMQGARLHLGYRRFADRAGREWRGHEFHYSKVEELEAISSAAKLYNARGEAVETPIYRYRNVIAGYTHLYWGASGIQSLWDNL